MLYTMFCEKENNYIIFNNNLIFNNQIKQDVLFNLYLSLTPYILRLELRNEICNNLLQPRIRVCTYLTLLGDGV